MFNHHIVLRLKHERISRIYNLESIFFITTLPMITHSTVDVYEIRPFI
jgi:hypothetical protein